MHIVRAHDVFFDHVATAAMGVAFDSACRAMEHFGGVDRVRQLIAKRIIEAARSGERDPIRLQAHALLGFDPRVPTRVSVVRDVPRPGYALVARTA